MSVTRFCFVLPPFNAGTYSSKLPICFILPSVLVYNYHFSSMVKSRSNSILESTSTEH